MPDRTTAGWQAVQLPHTWNDKDVLADGQRDTTAAPAGTRKDFALFPKREKGISFGSKE
ncbi:hypothetical protein [Tannerella forsythia]|uniref:hypothetical protein n=1 Tax=Tannerella forsythia TaxID=28112 RepID=UPI001C8B0452|nr:hypothetical protein [Tannerella forsythia]